MWKGLNPDRGKRFTFPLLHNIQYIPWDPPSLVMNGYCGFLPWINGLRHRTELSLSSRTNEGSYSSTPLVSPAGMNKRFVYL
jgi:hypothetical protein